MSVGAGIETAVTGAAETETGGSSAKTKHSVKKVESARAPKLRSFFKEIPSKYLRSKTR